LAGTREAGGVSMKTLDTLLLGNPNFLFSREDCERLQDAFGAAGYSVGLIEIEGLYSLWSEETHCAGWLAIVDFDERVQALLHWIRTRQG
jgi:hypothetical protein